MSMISEMIQQFNANFDTAHTPRIFFAPCQFNIMGGNADYNKGKALPFALSFGMYAIIHKRDDTLIRLHSADHPDKPITCDIRELAYHPKDHWANHSKGVIYSMKKSGLPINSGFDILFISNIPESNIFSATNPLEFVTAYLLNDLFDLQLDKLTLVKYCHKTERDYIGFTKGMVNKIATAFGKSGQALLLDCDTLESEWVPLDLGKYQLMIIDIHKKKTISPSVFTEKHNECEIALQHLQSYMNIKHLGELTTETLANAKQVFHSHTFKRRLQHIVSENERTQQAAEFIKQQDVISLGKTFTASQISLQNDDEIADEEITQAVTIANKQTGVLGCRIGAGDSVGGIVALIDSDYLLSIQKRIYDQYLSLTGTKVHFYEAAAHEGTKEVMEGEFEQS